MFRFGERIQNLRVGVVLAGLLWAVAIGPRVAVAQTTPDEETLRLRSRQETEDRTLRRLVPDTRIRPDIVPGDELVLPIETTCFSVRDIRLTGQRLEAFPWAHSYLDRYKDNCLGVEGINLILKGLSGKFIAKGFITTRVLLPEQDLSKGTLVYLLIPGVVRDIRFNTVEPVRLWKTAFPLRSGDILNLRDIEQGLEQLKRIPSQDVNFKIVPGDRQGESDIVIEITRTRPWRVLLSADDSGSRATGKLQSSVTAYLDNPFDLNDMFMVSFNGDVERQGAQLGTRGNSISYSVPWGYWTTSISDSTYEYHQTIQGATQSFVSSGVLENIEMKVDRIVGRDQVSKTSLQLSVAKRRNRSFVDDTEVAVQRREVTSAELSLLYRRYFGVAQLDVALGSRQGVSWFDAQDEPADPLPGQPTTRYKLQTLDVSLVAPFTSSGTAARYIGSFRAQTTDDDLYTSEFFSIGNRYTVRGFDGDHTLAAERGWFLRNEFEFPFVGPNSYFYMGIDHGQVAGPSAGLLIGDRLTGTVVGIRGRQGGFNYDFFAGWALAKPDGYRTDDISVGGQVGYQF